MKLLVAGGGTGGHLFPGVAVAEELRARDPDAPVLFVGTERGIEARVLPGLGWQLELIEVRGIKTVGLRGALRGALSVPRALWQSRKLLKRFRPDVVVGVGGYASGPVVLMARLMRIPCAILEQNSIPGLANKILGKVVHAVFLAFDETRRFFPARKVLMTGNPIRARITGSAAASEAPGERPRLLVFGGSQGALEVNRRVAGALKILKDRGMLVDVVHQAGQRGYEETLKKYEELGIEADVRAFIEDMAAAYRRADLVLARAGATTVAELGVVGRPAILIPYPYAAYNHQEINARELVEAGAAKMYRQEDLTPERLASALEELLSDREALERMGSAMKALGRPRAAASIVDWCESRVPQG